MMSPTDPVVFAKALADETRQEIMRLCCCQWLSVGEIVEAMGISQPTVSHHLNVLKKARLVRARRDGKQVYYTLIQEALANGCCTLAENFAPDHELVLLSPAKRE
jgi:ArsR family transcriptional regulator